MTSQFKNPMPGRNQSGSQQPDWQTEGPQPATPGDRSQGALSPTEQTPNAKNGSGLLLPPWPGKVLSKQTPSSSGVVDQPTIKQPSMGAGPYAGSGAANLPQTPNAGYVQGQYGQYGQMPAGQYAPGGSFGGGSMVDGGMGANRYPGTGALNPAFNPNNAVAGGMGYNQLNAGGGLSMPGMGMGMVAAPPDPGMFGSSPKGKLADGPRQKRAGNDQPPRKGGKKRRKKRRFPIWARVLVALLLVMIGLAGAGYGYYQANFAGAINSITGQKVPLAAGEENPNANLNGDILSGPRINILLLGSDTDEKFSNGSYIAQTDIVITIDPATKAVGMLSIPRDFYVDVPDYGMHKLDEAYGLGGVDLSRRTIEDDFGIPINYFAWVGLDGFIKVIDEVGGVDVDALHPITDDNYPDDVGKDASDPYGVMRLYIAPGPQHMDGETALEYVRSRHADLVGDFGRSARQQQVLTALKPKLENPNIFGQLSAIANDLQGYLKTDMELPDILKLMNFARTLDITKVNKLILEPPYSSSGTATTGADVGQDVVFPDCDKIAPALQQFFDSTTVGCNVNGSSNLGQPSLASSAGTFNAVASVCSPSVLTLDDTQPLSQATADASGSANGLVGDAADLFGIRGLLDLLFLGVFETPEGFEL